MRRKWAILQGPHQPAEGAPREGKAGDKDADEDNHGISWLRGDGCAGEGEAGERRSGRLHDEHGDARHKEQRLAPKPGSATKITFAARVAKF